MDPVEHVDDPIQGQVKGARRLVGPSGVQRDAPPRPVDDGGTTGTTGGVRARPSVECVLVLVVVVVLRAVPVHPGNGGGQDLDLLDVVVSYHQHLSTHLEAIGCERDPRGWGEAQPRGVELQQPKVVHRVSVYRLDWELLVFVEGGEGENWACGDDVPVCEDER